MFIFYAHKHYFTNPFNLQKLKETQTHLETNLALTQLTNSTLLQHEQHHEHILSYPSSYSFKNPTTITNPSF